MGTPKYKLANMKQKRPLEDKETSSTSAAKRLLLQKSKCDTIKYNSLLASVACTSLKELLMTLTMAISLKSIACLLFWVISL